MNVYTHTYIHTYIHYITLHYITLHYITLCLANVLFLLFVKSVDYPKESLVKDLEPQKAEVMAMHEQPSCDA